MARLKGAAKVLQKPFTNALLIAAVYELLPERRGATGGSSASVERGLRVRQLLTQFRSTHC